MQVFINEYERIATCERHGTPGCPRCAEERRLTAQADRLTARLGDLRAAEQAMRREQERRRRPRLPLTFGNRHARRRSEAAARRWAEKRAAARKRGIA